MTPTPVGMRCPECMRQKTKVVQGVGGGPASGFAASPATFVLIAVSLVVYLVEVGTSGGGFSIPINDSVVVHGALFGPLVSEGEWYRLITSGFIHGTPLHVGFNMVLLFFLGRLLEPALGTPRFLFLYFASLLAGSFGALLLDPNAVSYGASGAVFGLAGATFVVARGRGMDALAGEIGFLIVINLVFSFAVPHISVGGHLGGLAAGVICAAAIVAGDRGMLGRNRFYAELAAMTAVAAAAFLGALAVA
jgi:membrane associated rhomboid family serine protease